METYTNILFKTISVPDTKNAQLSLCPLRSDNVALNIYTEWMNNHDIIKYLGRSSKPTTLVSQQSWLDRQNEKSNKDTTFNIVLKDESGTVHLIGNCSLICSKDSTNHGIIGIVIGNKSYQGKHYGRLALQMLLDFAFNEENLHCVSLTVAEDNVGAIKCYESLGFQTQGKHRDMFYYEGEYHNALYMDITKEEFNGNLALFNVMC